jgi:mersacidin/lichenicidin family type 2 lantibiotic
MRNIFLQGDSYAYPVSRSGLLRGVQPIAIDVGLCILDLWQGQPELVLPTSKTVPLHSKRRGNPMSNEQIIRSWKDEETTEKDEHANEKEVENPAGGQELTPEELEKIEGGSQQFGSCTITSC